MNFGRMVAQGVKTFDRGGVNLINRGQRLLSRRGVSNANIEKLMGKTVGAMSSNRVRMGVGAVSAYSGYSSQKNFRRGNYGRAAAWGAMAGATGMGAWRSKSIANSFR